MVILLWVEDDATALPVAAHEASAEGAGHDGRSI
jgi:hypothetical protein